MERKNKGTTHIYALAQGENGGWAHITTHFLAEITDMYTLSTFCLVISLEYLGTSWNCTLCACLSKDEKIPHVFETSQKTWILRME